MMLYKVVLVGGSPWGFRLEDYKGTHGAKIAKINTSSKAQSHGIQIGDVISRVNDQSVTGLSSTEVMKIVRSAGDTLALELIREQNSDVNGEDDILSSSLSSKNSFSLVSSSFSTLSADGEKSICSSENQPFSAKPTTTVWAPFGQNQVKSYRPVSFDISKSSSTDQEKSIVSHLSLSSSDTVLKNPEMISDGGHMKSSSIYSVSSNNHNKEANSSRSSDSLKSGSNLSRSHDLFDSNSLTLASTSSSLSDAQNSHPFSLRNGNVLDELPRLPMVQNPTITLLQKKRAEGQIQRNSSPSKEKIEKINREKNENEQRISLGLTSNDVNDRKQENKKSHELLTSSAKKSSRYPAADENNISLGINSAENANDQDKTDSWMNEFKKSKCEQGSSVSTNMRGKWNQSENSSEKEKNINGKYYTVVESTDENGVMSTKRLVKFEGIGPMDETTGIPIATRNSLDEKNHKDWYKRMYKSLHKSESNNDSIYVFPGEDPELYSQGSNLQKSLNGVKYTIRKATPDDKIDLKYESNLSLMNDKKIDSSSSTFLDSTKYSKPSTSFSPQKKHIQPWTPTDFKYENQTYKNQPRSIEDYEPGYSSVVLKEEKPFRPSIGDFSKEEETLLLSKGKELKPETSQHLRMNSESFGWNLKTENDKMKRLNGNENLLPQHSRMSSLTSIPSLSTASVYSDLSKPNSNYRQSWLESLDDSLNPSTLYIHGRSGSNLNTNENGGYNSHPHDTSQLKSVDAENVVQNRKHDRNSIPSLTNDQDLQINSDTITSAEALYDFRAQSPTDISFDKGEFIYVFNQIDENWCEGECNGKIGKFPLNHVRILTPEEETDLLKKQNVGQGRALYNFTAQTTLELSFKKNEILILVSRIDRNWFEGSIGNRSGLVPANFIEIINEPNVISSPRKSPLPSNTTRSSNSYDNLSSNVSSLSIKQKSPTKQQDPDLRIDRLTNGSRLFPETNVINSQKNAPDPLNIQNKSYNKVMTVAPPPPKYNVERHKMEFNEVGMNTRSLRHNSLNPATTYVGPDSSGMSYSTQKPDDKVWQSRKVNHVHHGSFQGDTERNFGTSRCRAAFAYAPTKPDELELVAGDIIYVMEKYDDGWFVGMSERTKKMGTFPGNHVQGF